MSANVLVKHYVGALNRMKCQQEPLLQSLTFSYDAAGNRTLAQDSLNGVTTSVYDALHRLTQRQFGGTGQTPLHVALTWTARDQLATVSRYNDQSGSVLVGTSSYVYDSAERLTSLQHADGSGNVLASYVYAYDAGSRLTLQVVDGVSTSYNYDRTSQLTQAGTASYSYDAAGNRNMAGYQTGTGDQITNDGVWTYTHDAAGELTKKSKGASAETWTYGYDAKGRMVWAQDRATDGGTLLSAATYVYDVKDRLIEEDATTTTGGLLPVTTVTRWWYDGQNAWAELAVGAGLLTRRLFLDGVDQPLARIDATGTPAWYLADRQGSIRDVVNFAGTMVLDHLAYDAYGKVTSESSPSNGDAFAAYDGYRRDGVTGYYLTWHRWYDPATGGWTTRDPSGFAGGDSNEYRYVHNGPTDGTDPSGEKYSSVVDPAQRHVSILMDIDLYAPPLATTALALQWSRDIVSAWSGHGNSPAYATWTLSVQVTMRITSSYFNSGHQNVVQVMPVGWIVPGYTDPTVNADTDNNHSVWGGTIGYGEWSVNTRDWSIGHEAGHLLGFADYYNTTPGQFAVLPGYENTIMAENGGSASTLGGPDHLSFRDRLLEREISVWQSQHPSPDETGFWEILGECLGGVPE